MLRCASFRFAATCEKAGLASRTSRALPLELFIAPYNDFIERRWKVSWSFRYAAKKRPSALLRFGLSSLRRMENTPHSEGLTRRAAGTLLNSIH